MKSTRSCLGRATLASLLLGPASAFAADQTISGNLTVTGDADVAGALGVMGNIETDGSVRAAGPIISGGIESWSILAQGGIYTVGRKVVFKGATHGTTAYSTLAGRGLALLIIDRASLSVVSHINYDCYGSDTEREAMATALNALGDEKFVVITSGDAWRTNANLKAALLRVGASPAAVETDGNLSYALVGIPGIGAGNGIEALNEVGNATPLASVGAQFIRPAADTNSAYELGGRKDSTFIKNDGTFQFTKPVSVSGGLTVNGSPVLTSAGGNGANLTGLNAANISTGTLDASLLPSNAVQLTANQTLSGKTLVGAALTGNTTLGGATSAQQATFTSNGFLGININPPADYIHIKTSALQRNGGITLQTYTDNQADIRFQDSGGTYRWALGFQDGPTKDFRIANSGALDVAPALTINNSTQNLGIGTATPGAKLQVAGNSIFGIASGIGESNVTFRADSPAANVDLFSLNFQRSNYAPTGTAAAIVMGRESGASEGTLSFRTNDGNSLIERMRIMANGNVGIGTTSTSERLNVGGDIRTSGSFIYKGVDQYGPFATPLVMKNWYGLNSLVIQHDSPTNFADYKISFRDSANANATLSYWRHGVALDNPASTFNIAPASGQSADLLRVNGNLFKVSSSGNVGIGVSAAPSEKLEVAGNVKVSGSLTVGGAPVLTTTGNGGGLTGLNAGSLATGTISTARLPVDVVQTNSTQTLNNKTMSGAILTGVTLLGASGHLDASNNAELNVTSWGSMTLAAPVVSLGTEEVRVGRDAGHEPTIRAELTDGSFIDNQDLKLTPAGEGRLILNGNTIVSGNVTVKNHAIIRVSPAGDIPMIAGAAGADPSSGL